MRDMEWVDKIETGPKRTQVGLSRRVWIAEEEYRKLIAAVRLAEHMLGGLAAETQLAAASRVTTGYAVAASDLFHMAREIEKCAARLRSGEVEEVVAEPKPTHNTIRLSRAELDALPEYSCSFPTGQTIGRRWRNNAPAFSSQQAQRIREGKSPLPPEWWMGEYVECDEPGMIGIKWAKIEVAEEKP